MGVDAARESLEVEWIRCPGVPVVDGRDNVGELGIEEGWAAGAGETGLVGLSRSLLRELRMIES